MPGNLDIGRYPSGTDQVTDRVAADLRSAGFESVPRPDIMAWKNRKLVTNAVGDVSTVLPDEADELKPLVRAEAEAVLAAAGVPMVSHEADRERRGDLLQGRPDVDGPNSLGQSIERRTAGPRSTSGPARSCCSAACTASRPRPTSWSSGPLTHWQGNLNFDETRLIFRRKTLVVETLSRWYVPARGATVPLPSEHWRPNERNPDRPAHPVQDYAVWREVYDGAEVASLHAKHGVSNARVGRNPDDGNDVLVTHDFDSVDAAQNFAGDPELAAVIERPASRAPPRSRCSNLPDQPPPGPGRRATARLPWRPVAW